MKGLFIPDITAEMFRNGCLESIEALMAEGEIYDIEYSPWIPVSERLPKIAGVYRVTRYYPNNVMNPNYLVDACFFDGSDTWYNDNRINHERAYVDNIIAWQENPEPYTKEKKMSDYYEKIDKQQINNAITLLDMFTKNYCRYSNDYARFEDLKFRCNECPFSTEDSLCLVKQFKEQYAPDYNDFGAMGDL